MNFFSLRLIRSFVFLGLLPGLLLGTLSVASAQTSDEEQISRDSCFDEANKQDTTGAAAFLESDRSLENFDKMRPECQKYILGSLLGQGYHYQEREGVEPEDTVPDRDLILKKYLDGASGNLKRQVYSLALVELTETVTPLRDNADVTAEIFQKLVTEEPAKAPQTLCQVLWDLGTSNMNTGPDDIHPELLGANNERVDRLRPLLAMKPGLATQFCDFSEGSTGKNKAYPIRYLLDLAASEAEKLKWAANLQRNGDTTEWVRKYSACTEDQLVSIFHRSLQIFNPGRDPYQIYIIETQGTCSVRGILRIVQNKNHAKEKPSYLFFPSSQIRFQEPQVKPLVFSDVFEIARTLKRDPRTYVLNKAQPLPKPVALPPVSVHASAPPAPKPSSGDGVSLQGAYEAVLQLFKSGTEAVTGRGR